MATLSLVTAAEDLLDAAADTGDDAKDHQDSGDDQDDPSPSGDLTLKFFALLEEVAGIVVNTSGGKMVIDGVFGIVYTILNSIGELLSTILDFLSSCKKNSSNENGSPIKFVK